MITSSLFPGRYVQGYGALGRLGKELARFGQRALVVSDPFVEEEILPRYRAGLEAELEASFASFGGESSDEEIQRLAARGREAGVDIVAGLGGGKTLDTAKAVAYELKVPVASVPTIASTDAPCSALSVIYTPEGVFERYLVLPTNPALVLVDSQVVVEAPVQYLVAGMGDALATRFEAEACQRTYAPNMTGDVGSLTAYSLARLCYDTLLEYGPEALAAAEARAVTPAVEHIIEANTLLSGLGFESGGLGAAHAIHNGFTALEATHGATHGEKVTLGTLAALILTDRDSKLIEEVYAFCVAVGLPTTLAEIGLEGVSDEDLLKVGEAACAEGETIHNEAVPVTAESVAAALKAADALGREAW